MVTDYPTEHTKWTLRTGIVGTPYTQKSAQPTRRAVGADC